jgi:hypothetical protein
MKKARALRTIRRLKLKAGETELSDWEGEFLDSVETRIGTYGRAFADPEKGDRESALSILQARKLREIGAKADGETPARKGGRTRPPSAKARPDKTDASKDGANKGGASRPGMIRRKPFGARKRDS